MSDKELNAWIAEKLMSWTDVWLSATDARGKPPDRDGHFVVPAFSTDLAMAFEVVERMRERGAHIDIEADEKGYVVWANYNIVTGQSATCLADLARAICLAAKQALEKSK